MKQSIPKKCRNDITDMRTVPERNEGRRFGCRKTELQFSYSKGTIWLLESSWSWGGSSEVSKWDHSVELGAHVSACALASLGWPLGRRRGAKPGQVNCIGPTAIAEAMQNCDLVPALWAAGRMEWRRLSSASYSLASLQWYTPCHSPVCLWVWNSSYFFKPQR